MLAHY